MLTPKFQLLRTYLEGQIEHRPAIIVVSSAHENDGRAITARGLADSFKLVGHRTALLEGEAPSSDSPITSAATSEVKYIRINLGDADASSFEAMSALAAGLRREYTFVVVDAPPLLQYPSVLVLAGIADAVLLSVRQGRAAIPEDQLVVRMLKLAKANLVGVVAVDAEHVAKRASLALPEPKQVAVRPAPLVHAGNARSSVVGHFLSLLRRS